MGLPCDLGTQQLVDFENVWHIPIAFTLYSKILQKEQQQTTIKHDEKTWNNHDTMPKKHSAHYHSVIPNQTLCVICHIQKRPFTLNKISRSHVNQWTH